MMCISLSQGKIRPAKGGGSPGREKISGFLSKMEQLSFIESEETEVLVMSERSEEDQKNLTRGGRRRKKLKHG